jgi:hypothetical protein
MGTVLVCDFCAALPEGKVRSHWQAHGPCKTAKSRGTTPPTHCKRKGCPEPLPRGRPAYLRLYHSDGCHEADNAEKAARGEAKRQRKQRQAHPAEPPTPKALEGIEQQLDEARQELRAASSRLEVAAHLGSDHPEYRQALKSWGHRRAVFLEVEGDYQRLEKNYREGLKSPTLHPIHHLDRARSRADGNDEDLAAANLNHDGIARAKSKRVRYSPPGELRTRLGMTPRRCPQCGEFIRKGKRGKKGEPICRCDYCDGTEERPRRKFSPAPLANRVFNPQPNTRPEDWCPTRARLNAPRPNRPTRPEAEMRRARERLGLAGPVPVSAGVNNQRCACGTIVGSVQRGACMTCLQAEALALDRRLASGKLRPAELAELQAPHSNGNGRVGQPSEKAGVAE